MSANPSIAYAPVAPRTLGRRIGSRLLPIVAIIVVAAGLAALAYGLWMRKDETIITGQFYTVTPTDLEVKINKDGELQAISYTDVKSEVESATQIIFLIPEGTSVKKGDVLIKLDSSTLQTKKESSELDLKKAESSVKIAREMKEIQDSQNSANREAAEVAVELAEIELRQFTEGTYPQNVLTAKTTLSMASLMLANKQKELDQTRSLYLKGFVTQADVEKGQLDVTKATNDVNVAETALKVLEKYSHALDTAKLKSALAQAEQKLARTLKENASMINQKAADLDEKEHSLELIRRNAKKLQEQLDACSIRAPEDGLVIYASSIDRNLKDQIQEGTLVRQSQWLLRLPDVRNMKAVLKIQEAQKPKLDESRQQRALVKILGVPQPIGATLTRVSVLPDDAQRWWNPDLREYPVELTLDETPAGMKPGIRVENAEIFISRLERALTVPLGAVYTVGRDSYVFVRTPEGVKERKVVLGITNETQVQLSEGISDSEQVLLLQAGQGRLLLEKAGVKVVESATRPSAPPGRKNRGGPKVAAAPPADKATEKNRTN